MRPLEKINLIKNIRNALEKYNHQEQGEFLKYSKIDFTYYSWENEHYIDFDCLFNVLDHQKLVNLASELEISTNLATLSKNYPRNWETNENLKAFISHSTNQKKSAHNHKEALKLNKINMNFVL